MITNSPNPVDGDVQALIQVCNNQIELFNKMLADDYYIHTWEAVRLHLTIAKTALAALKAEPIGFIHNCINPGDTETTSRIFKEENRHYGRAVYLNHPTQLLRPVELPKSQRLDGNGYGYYFDMDDVFRALEEADVPFKSQG